MTAITWNTSTSSGWSVDSSTNVATKNSGSNSWSDNYLRSNESFEVGTPWEITFKNRDTSKNVMIGFNKASIGHYFNNPNDYSFYMSDQYQTIYENGSVAQSGDGTPISNVTEYKITIDSDGRVKYYVDDSLKLTSSLATGTYYVDLHAYTNSGQGYVEFEQGSANDSNGSLPKHGNALNCFKKQKDWF